MPYACMPNKQTPLNLIIIRKRKRFARGARTTVRCGYIRSRGATDRGRTSNAKWGAVSTCRAITASAYIRMPARECAWA